MKTWTTADNGIEIIRLLGMRCNCYLVRRDGISVVIDTSVRREYATLVRNLQDLQVEALTCILLTHVHFDHVANLARLQEKFGCPVYVHSLEADFLQQGYTRLPKGTKPLTKLAVNFVGDNVWNAHRFQPYIGEVFTESSEDLSTKLGPVFEQLNLQVLHTPGHTDGSVSYLIDAEVALVGDAMVNEFLPGIFPPFANAPKQLPATWNKLLDSNCRCFLPAHGSEVNRGQVERGIQSLLKKM